MLKKPVLCCIFLQDLYDKGPSHVPNTLNVLQILGLACISYFGWQKYYEMVIEFSYNIDHVIDDQNLLHFHELLVAVE